MHVKHSPQTLYPAFPQIILRACRLSSSRTRFRCVTGGRLTDSGNRRPVSKTRRTARATGDSTTPGLDARAVVDPKAQIDPKEGGCESPTRLGDHHTPYPTASAPRTRLRLRRPERRRTGTRRQSTTNHSNGLGVHSVLFVSETACYSGSTMCACCRH